MSVTILDEPEVRYLGDIQRLSLKPDDILVLRTTHILSAQQVTHLEETFTKKLGTDNKVVVLAHGLEIGVLTPEPA